MKKIIIGLATLGCLSLTACGGEMVALKGTPIIEQKTDATLEDRALVELEKINFESKDSAYFRQEVLKSLKGVTVEIEQSGGPLREGDLHQARIQFTEPLDGARAEDLLQCQETGELTAKLKSDVFLSNWVEANTVQPQSLGGKASKVKLRCVGQDCSGLILLVEHTLMNHHRDATNAVAILLEAKEQNISNTKTIFRPVRTLSGKFADVPSAEESFKACNKIQEEQEQNKKQKNSNTNITPDVLGGTPDTPKLNNANPKQTPEQLPLSKEEEVDSFNEEMATETPVVEGDSASTEEIKTETPALESDSSTSEEADLAAEPGDWPL